MSLIDIRFSVLEDSILEKFVEKQTSQSTYIDENGVEQQIEPNKNIEEVEMSKEEIDFEFENLDLDSFNDV